MSADEFGELIALGGIKHHLKDTQDKSDTEKLQTKSQSKQSNTLFHDLLARLVSDIKNDELFEP